MTILRDLSLVWSMIHVLILFIFFYESRYSRKKTLILTCIVMIPVAAINLVGVILYGPELMGQVLVLTATLPSAIFFFIIAKNRNWKFLFTFCVVDTISYEMLAISKLIDYYLCGDKYIAMFFIRLIAFPLMEWLAYKYVRKPFLEIKNSVRSGWSIFTIVTMIYYALLLVTINFPTLIVYRSEYIPAVLLILLLMPITYVGIFITLRNQMRLINAENREQIFEIQANSLLQRVEEMDELEEENKIQRHDMRHRYAVLGEMLKGGKLDEAIKYIEDTSDMFDIKKSRAYCSDPVINAVFGYFVRKAEHNMIRTDIQISFPPDLDFNSTELSVVIANIFENAINACMILPVESRYITCQSISTPQFMFRITNPFNGKVSFGSDGLPKTNKVGHGTGVHSVAAFCEKYDVYYEFKVEDGKFVFNMLK